VTKRSALDDESCFALWSHKTCRLACQTRAVVVAHLDTCVGESIALLLRCKGFGAVHTPDLESVELMLGYWRPGACLIDTRLGNINDFRFVRAAILDPAFQRVLMVAMTNVFVEETPSVMREVGFDSLCRRPCPVWRLADMLNSHFGPPRVADR
jgi:hypothetical protein